MKRIAVLAVLCLYLLSFVGCGKQTPQSIMPPETGSATTCPTYSEEIPETLLQYAAPWRWDAPASAIADGKLHYYFMSGKGMLTNYEPADPYKWGDSTLIVFPNGQTMLVDVGVEAYAPVLAANLKQMGIDCIDYLMISHPHGDHFGGILSENSFLDMIAVDTVLYSGVDRGEKTALFYAKCAERGIPVQFVHQGDSFDFGNVHMEILWPFQSAEGELVTKTEPINNRSIVARFDFQDHSSLFAGDLYASGEMSVITSSGNRLDVDLLKVPHHGYSTSSTGMFIYSVRPKLAVAMSGYNYAIQTAYESSGATFLYDRYEGYIHVMTDGTTMTYDTERNG